MKSSISELLRSFSRHEENRFEPFLKRKIAAKSSEEVYSVDVEQLGIAALEVWAARSTLWNNHIQSPG
jgi:hypothetical protein